MRKNYARHILAMDDTELEQFVDDWLERKKEKYVGGVDRFSGPGDLGRDVVGYRTPMKHDGPWDNYQCKQLRKTLLEADAIKEFGKIFFHSSQGRYSLPTNYFFVAPRGVNRAVQELAAHPSRWKARILAKWDEWCAGKIVENKSVPLDSEIRDCIEGFDFNSVSALDAAKILKDPDVRPVLVKWFGEDPGEAPVGVVPDDIQKEEQPFINQLVDAYCERYGPSIASVSAASAHSECGEHLRLQRTRYFDAASFKRYYRENTPPEYLATFETDVYHGIIDLYRELHPDAFSRIDRVMSQAAAVSASGVLGRYARVTVRQGICHHFVNEGRLKWKT